MKLITVVHQLAKMESDNSPVIMNRIIKVLTVAITLQVIDLIKERDFLTFMAIGQGLFL
jgi:hypothetical protein